MKNVTWHQSSITLDKRIEKNGFRPQVFWLTGLSGSGKSTLANQLGEKLFSKNKLIYILDGDNIRHGLCQDLGFSNHERTENIRRVAEVAKLFVDSGTIAIVALISPLIKDRGIAKKIIGDKFFNEIFIHCPIEVCEKRDPKGLYQKAHAGEIKNFTGVDSPFEQPITPDLTISTSTGKPSDNLELLINFAEKKIKND